MFNENNIHFVQKSVPNFNVVTTCEFSIWYKITLWFKSFYISTNDEKIILKFVVRSIALARPGTIFSVLKEITHIKNIIFIIKSGIFVGYAKSYFI